MNIIKRFWRREKNKEDDVYPEYIHWRNDGSFYVNAEEFFNSKQGQELLAEYKGWNPTIPLSERPHDLAKAQERARKRAEDDLAQEKEE